MGGWAVPTTLRVWSCRREFNPPWVQAPPPGRRRLPALGNASLYLGGEIRPLCAAERKLRPPAKHIAPLNAGGFVGMVGGWRAQSKPLRPLRETQNRLHALGVLHASTRNP